jgi:hypothetical protein
MTSLLAADFYLVEGDLVKVTVEAMNTIDYSTPSLTSGVATVQIEPHDPLSAPQRGENTNENQVEVVFNLITADGGAAIERYSIEMDSGSGFVEVSEISLLSSPAVI